MQTDTGVECALSNNDLLALYLCICLSISLIQLASLQETEVEPKGERKKERKYSTYLFPVLPPQTGSIIRIIIREINKNMWMFCHLSRSVLYTHPYICIQVVV